MSATLFLSKIDRLAPNALVAEDDRARFLKEWRGDFESDALAVAAPASVSEVVAIVRACAEHGITIVPQGGNTGLCGGAVSRQDKL